MINKIKLKILNFNIIYSASLAVIIVSNGG